MPSKGSTRAKQQQQGEEMSANKKVHMMPAPAGKDNKMMMLPPPARFGSNGISSQSVSFNNIIYLAAQHAQNLKQDVAGQARDVCKVLDKLLAESMSDKTKIIRADIFIKDKNHFQEV